ncbi:MAG: manganese efflux pump [Stomatobaculum sp.]|nr:manganese efflux pump [Stomatobaculum sp.]
MSMNLVFFLNSAALGVGLAMDAFSVSLANGLHEPRMPRGRMYFIAGVYAFFQFLMPMTGWACIHTIAVLFSAFRKMIPWIALGLLLYLGGKMILEGVQERNSGSDGWTGPCLSGKDLLLQGIATSIDALSVGFAIAEYALIPAFIASLIIAAVTFIICIGGLLIGRKAGTALSWKASVLGGCILVLIGIEIFLKNL